MYMQARRKQKLSGQARKMHACSAYKACIACSFQGESVGMPPRKFRHSEIDLGDFRTLINYHT